jgi:hypothetical protein
MLPTRTQLRDQIVEVIGVRLLDPLEILLEGDPALDPLRTSVAARARELAHRILTADDHTALTSIARLVGALYPGDEPFDPPVDWWRTPMGQVVVWRVGHPTADHVSYPVAGAMLGISRQGVHDLVSRGKLTRHPDGGVVPASIRARLRQEGGRPA